jgi:hypothetical protein
MMKANVNESEMLWERNHENEREEEMKRNEECYDIMSSNQCERKYG